MLKKVTKLSRIDNGIESVAVIGAGQLGAALSQEFYDRDILKFVLIRNPEKANEMFQEFFDEVPIYCNITNINIFPDAIFLTVPDSEIEKVAEEIANEHSAKLSNTVFIHCSGSKGLEVLAPLKNHCKGVASLHPYQTFYGENLDALYDIGWTIQCDKKLKPALKKFIDDLDGSPVFIDKINNFDKNKYHISAVFASNYLATNLYFANNLAIQSGIEPELFVPPIESTTAENMTVFESEFDYALTGPIARGDIEIVKSHIESVKNDVLLHKSYVLMGLATAETAYAEKIIKKEIYIKFKKLFISEINTLYSE
jgi:predicted short-subunit dehydrogenase-like oxidoreductase (DUF2520 family)